MGTRARLTRVSLTIMVTLTALASSASANRFEISNQGIRFTWAALRWSPQIALGLELICPVTMEGTFHSRTMAKEFERLVGYITRAIVNRSACSFTAPVSGFAFQAESLPWHIRYDTFEGLLPATPRVMYRMVLVGFIVEVEGGVGNCLYKSTVARPSRGWFERNTTTGQATNYAMSNSAKMPRFSGSILCPESGIFEEIAQVRLLGSATTLIFIRLI
jgi:hypothetical protein